VELFGLFDTDEIEPKIRADYASRPSVRQVKCTSPANASVTGAAGVRAAGVVVAAVELAWGVPGDASATGSGSAALTSSETT